MRELLRLGIGGLALGCLLLWWASPAWALDIEVVADFDAGSSIEVDGYPGIPGDGWTSEWKQGDYHGQIDATVDNTTEMGSGLGNYLNVDFKATLGGDVASWGGVGRDYDGGLIDITEDHTISFKYRVNEDLSLGKFDELNDAYYMFDHNMFVETAPSAPPYVRWLVAAWGNNYGIGDPGDHDWMVYDWNTSTMINTNIPVTRGNVLDVQVTVHPNATPKPNFDLYMNDGVNTPFSGTGYGWRAAENIGGFLHFTAREVTVESPAVVTRDFSVDAIKVSQTVTVGGMDTIELHFNAGNTTTQVDGYEGKAGDGWDTPWNGQEARATCLAGVESLNEIKTGGGNHLEVTLDSFDPGEPPAEYGLGAVGRDYTRVNELGIDFTKRHKISFTVRIDEDVSDFTEFYDMYQISDGAAMSWGPTSSSTWQISAFGGHVDPLDPNSSPGPGMVGEWTVLDGNRDGDWAPEDSLDTDIALTTGGIYDFEIVVDPSDQSYDITITDTSDPDNPFSATDLGWRTASDYVGGWLIFAERVNDADDQRAWSIDDIVITTVQVPGDTDEDGDVDQADLETVADNWGSTTATGPEQGDFNDDGVVGPADAAILAAHWGTGTGEEVTGLPEPSVLVGLLGLLLSLGGFRGRRGRRVGQAVPDTEREY